MCLCYTIKKTCRGEDRAHNAGNIHDTFRLISNAPHFLHREQAALDCVALGREGGQLPVEGLEVGLLLVVFGGWEMAITWWDRENETDGRVGVCIHFSYTHAHATHTSRFSGWTMHEAPAALLRRLSSAFSCSSTLAAFGCVYMFMCVCPCRCVFCRFVFVPFSPRDVLHTHTLLSFFSACAVASSSFSDDSFASICMGFIVCV